MQTQPVTQRPSTWAFDPQKAKTIAIVYAIYLLIPWVWDWFPVLGDVVDAITFLIAYLMMKDSGTRTANTPLARSEPRTFDLQPMEPPQ